MGLRCQNCLFAVLIALAAVGCSKTKTVTQSPDAQLDQYLRLESAVQKRYDCVNPDHCKFTSEKAPAMAKDVNALIEKGNALKKAPQPADQHLEMQRKVAFDRLKAWEELAGDLKDELDELAVKANKAGGTAKPQATAPKPTVSPHFAQQRQKLEEELKDLGCETHGKGVRCNYSLRGGTINDLKNALQIRTKFRTYANIRNDEEKAYKAIGDKAPSDGTYTTVDKQLQDINSELVDAWNTTVKRSYKSVRFDDQMYPFPANATDEQILAQAAEAKAALERIDAIYTKVRNGYWDRVLSNIYITPNVTKGYDASALQYDHYSRKGPHIRVSVNITEQEFVDVLKTLTLDKSPEGTEHNNKIRSVRELRANFPIVNNGNSRFESRVEAPYASNDEVWYNKTLDEQIKTLNNFIALSKHIEDSAQAKNYTGGGRISILQEGKERESNGAIVLVSEKNGNSVEMLQKQIDAWLSKNSRQ